MINLTSELCENLVSRAFSIISQNKDYKKIVFYASRNEIVRITPKRFKGKLGIGNKEFLLTIGKPNYEERAYLKMIEKAGKWDFSRNALSHYTKVKK